MTVVGDLAAAELRAGLRRGELRFRVGPYTYALHSALPVIARGVATLYRDHPLVEPGGFADFHVGIRPANWVQRLRRRHDFFFDSQRPFNRIQRRHAYAFLEWGMNWCVSMCANEYLKLHAAVVAKHGVALVMPGLPGAGKSTLCAALALRGWRVLSDEHAMIPPGNAKVVPLNRPVSLKNESIAVIRAFDQRAVLGPVTVDTHKGRVAHMKSDLAPDSHDPTPVPARLMVFPEFVAGESVALRPRGKAESFIFAAHHSFNYSILGAAGFDAMTRYIDAVSCFDLRYGDLDQAVEVIEGLHREACAS